MPHSIPPLPILVDVARESALWAALPEAEAVIGRAVAAAVAAAHLAHRPGAELSVVLADDAGIARLNAAWRGRDRPTNVLSFPAAEPAAMAASPLVGDLVFAFETLQREAIEAGVPLDHHLAHLAVHGLLHCFGYDHVADEDAGAMEALEVRVLKGLGIADPYADAALAEEAR